MKPQKITQYACSYCGAEHKFEDDAENCCPRHAEAVIYYKCSECGEELKDEDTARECCWDGETMLLPSPDDLEAAGQQRLNL